MFLGKTSLNIMTLSRLQGVLRIAERPRLFRNGGQLRTGPSASGGTKRGSSPHGPLAPRNTGGQGGHLSSN